LPTQALGGVIAGDADWLYGMLSYTAPPDAHSIRSKEMALVSPKYMTSLLILPSAIPFYHTDGMVYSQQYGVIK